MIRRRLWPIVLLPLLLPGSVKAQVPDDARLMDVMVAAYPDFLREHDGHDLIFKDGTRMPFGDGKRNKSFGDLLDHPSLRDIFYTPYIMGNAGLAPELNIDPGRVRFQPFFNKMYGDCQKGETSKRLVDVVWLPRKWGKTVRITPVNGVAVQLAKISAELDRLPARFDPYLFPPAGTFNCRVIAGTDRVSAHGSGNAIDIATQHSHYWLWSRPGADGVIKWRNEIPLEIVDIFERHGFIWGGKWYHFDTMHFEYRPEIIAATKLR